MPQIVPFNVKKVRKIAHYVQIKRIKLCKYTNFEQIEKIAGNFNLFIVQLF